MHILSNCCFSNNIRLKIYRSKSSKSFQTAKYCPPYAYVCVKGFSISIWRDSRCYTWNVEMLRNFYDNKVSLFILHRLPFSSATHDYIHLFRLALYSDFFLFGPLLKPGIISAYVIYHNIRYDDVSLDFNFFSPYCDEKTKFKVHWYLRINHS